MAIIPGSQIRSGMVIIFEGAPYRVVSFRHTMQGRGSNQIPCKLRNIINGSTSEYRFRSDDKVERAFIDEKEMEYLYSDGDDYWFMNNENFEQISIKKEDLEDVVGYLLPNTVCKVQMYEGKPIGVELPASIQLKVVETEPSIKGATAAGNVTKPAKLETGITIQAPMFVETGDIVIVNTESGEYQGRPGRQ